jgi:hypothetical protein
MFKDSKRALSNLLCLFCPRHARPSFPPTDVRIAVTTKPLNQDPKYIPPYPSKASRTDPGPATREGALTNTKKFWERIVA